jgi:hypothetical protein
MADRFCRWTRPCRLAALDGGRRSVCVVCRPARECQTTENDGIMRCPRSGKVRAPPGFVRRERRGPSHAEPFAHGIETDPDSVVTIGASGVLQDLGAHRRKRADGHRHRHTRHRQISGDIRRNEGQISLTSVALVPKVNGLPDSSQARADVIERVRNGWRGSQLCRRRRAFAPHAPLANGQHTVENSLRLGAQTHIGRVRFSCSAR